MCNMHVHLEWSVASVVSVKCSRGAVSIKRNRKLSGSVWYTHWCTSGSVSCRIHIYAQSVAPLVPILNSGLCLAIFGSPSFNIISDTELQPENFPHVRECWFVPFCSFRSHIENILLYVCTSVRNVKIVY